MGYEVCDTGPLEDDAGCCHLPQPDCAIAAGRSSSQPDDLELCQPANEFAQGLMSLQIIHLILVAGVIDQIGKCVTNAAIDLLPERCCRGVQAVVTQGIEIEQHASAIGQGSEDGLCDFLNAHSFKNISPARFLSKRNTVLW